MQQLSSELLLNIFKRLDSLEMVLIMRVCKDWLEIIDDNKTLWRRLVLPKRENAWGWGISTVELFDRKSNSSLKEVHMRINIEEEQGQSFLDLLEKSKATLQTLCLSGNHFQSMFLLSDLCWRLPDLTSCKIFYHSSKSRVDLVGKDELPEEGKELKVFWAITMESLEEAFSKDPHRFDHLVSFRLEEPFKALTSIAILKQCSRTLKHLWITQRYDKTLSSSVTVDLPLLEVLELSRFITDIVDFPSWLRVPSSCTIVTFALEVITGLPQTKLWVHGLADSQLAITWPRLVELRVDRHWAALLTREECDGLIAVLRQRKANVNAGMEIEGVKMIPLKRLVIRFKYLNQVQLSQLRDLVEEVVDRKYVQR